MARTSDSYNVTELLSMLDDLKLVLRACAGKHNLCVAEYLVPLPACRNGFVSFPLKIEQLRIRTLQRVNRVTVNHNSVVLVLVDGVDGTARLKI